MSNTWASFRSNVRAYLKDTGDTPRYSDSLIYLYTCDALRDYSNWFPRIIRVEIDPVSGAYPLPSDFLDVRYVEYPDGTYLKSRVARPGYKFRSQSAPTLYWQVDNALKLNAVAKNSIFLTYGGSHAQPATNADDTFVLTVPQGDLEVLNLYVRAQCLGQTRSRQSNLDRFKRTGRRDDNPMLPETETLMDEYYRKIAERSRGGTVYLYGV